MDVVSMCVTPLCECSVCACGRDNRGKDPSASLYIPNLPLHAKGGVSDSREASSSEKIKKDSDGSKTSSVPDGILFSLITITDTEERDSCAYIGPRVHVGVDVKLKSPQFDVNANDIGPICLITYGPMGSAYSPKSEAQHRFTYSNKADYTGPKRCNCRQHRQVCLPTSQCVHANF
ncbi:hypothetical protein F2P81_004374 [Scophthalmus maximus]|uniref:Uncharacterized protein n=1 Tax=Scophthalmus maximus TaxID=52904 RepID=A0A6A4T9I4_SCOMX|nr:hypothetical protein F2P81_004374 [Scophthalmus maximus]